MKGFSNKILVIYPKESTISGASEVYRDKMKHILFHLNKLMQEDFDMQCYTIYSNVVDNYPIYGAKDIIDFDSADIRFLNKVAGVPVNLDTSSYQEIKQEAAKKFPIVRGTETKERFGIITKKQKYIGEKIIQSFPVVIDFQRPNAREYKNVPIKGQFIRLFVNYANFMVTGAIGTMELPIKDIIGQDYATRPLYNWGCLCK